MDKKDIFYFATLYGISCFFQPEENEIVPRNAICGLMIDICNIFATPIISLMGCGFPIKIHNRTITREELREMGLLD